VTSELIIKAPPDPIDWFDGLLLTDQHFRSLDQRFEHLLAYSTQAASPYFWGIRSLELDESGLRQGVLAVTRLEAIFPAGTAVLYTGSTAAPGMLREALEINLTQAIENKAWAARSGVRGIVYAELPNLADRDAVPNPFDENPASPRGGWSSPVEDDEVRRRRPAIFLQLGLTAPDHALPIARVIQHGGGHFTIDDDYVPPAPFVQSCNPLYRQCHEWAAQLRRKAVEAAVQARRHIAGGAAHLKAFALSAGLFQLEAVLRSEISHPFALYLAFCHTAGHLAGATLQSKFPTLSRYDHRDIRLSFEQVFQVISVALAAWPDQYSEHGFEWDEERRFFHLRIDPEWLAEPLLIQARVPQGVERARVRNWMESAVIALKPQMESVRRRRFLGAKRWLVDFDANLSFAYGEDTVLIRLEPNSEFLTPPSMLLSDSDSNILQILNPDDRDALPSALTLFVLAGKDVSKPPLDEPAPSPVVRDKDRASASSAG
jgi:type VI secretion system protein ImpJ